MAATAAILKIGSGPISNFFWTVFGYKCTKCHAFITKCTILWNYAVKPPPLNRSFPLTTQFGGVTLAEGREASPAPCTDIVPHTGKNRKTAFEPSWLSERKYFSRYIY